MARSVVQNTAFLTVASVAQKVIAFFYFTMVARAIGVEDTGRYIVALSYTTLVSIFVDLGMNHMLIREGARSHEKIPSLVHSILIAKLVIGLVVYTLFAAGAPLLSDDPVVRVMLLLSGLTMLFDSVHLTLYGALRAFGDLRYEAFGMVGSQLLTLLFGGFFLFIHAPLPVLMVAFLLPSIANVLYAGIMLVRKHNDLSLPWSLATSFKNAGSLLFLAIPFALSGIFARIYSYADTILLSHMADTAAVGIYGVAYKITFAFQFLPLAAMAALYPRISHLFHQKPSEVGVVVAQATRGLLLLAVPISIGIGALAVPIITLLYGADYLATIPVLQILIAGIIASFISFPLGACVNACNRQKAQTAIIGSVTGVNILLNIMLIPRFGPLGAAAAATTCNAVLAIAGFLALPKSIMLPWKTVLWDACRIGGAGILLLCILCLTRGFLPLPLLIGEGVFVFAICIWLFRIISPADMRLLRRSFSSADATTI